MSTRTPWDVLGIPKDSPEDVVKKAYKKLAMKHHPDKGGDPEQFKKIQAAYDTITKGPSAEVNEEFNPFEMFSQFFHQQHHHQKQLHDIRVKLEVAYRGHDIQLKVSDNDICTQCKCDVCKGMGHIQLGPFSQTCPKCGGKKSQGCSSCNNRGFKESVKNYTVHINPGTRDGTVIEVCEKFDVRILIEPDPVFEVDGFDLVYTVNMTFKESLVGKNITVPHLGGNFEYTSGFIKPNKKYIVKGKGLSKEGNLVFKFVIEYPDKLTNEQIEIFKLNL